jgi:hypothetical protein
VNGIKLGYIIGQVMPGICDNADVNIKVKKNVETAPPIYPSHVFLGESAINCLFPKKYPKIYANISLTIINIAGTI